MSPDDFKRLAAANLTTDQIALVMEMNEAARLAGKAEAEAVVEAGREKARARWQKWDAKRRSTNVDKRLPTTANASKQLTGGDARGDDKTSTQRIEPQKEEKKETRAARDVEFDAFWKLYPNRVGRAAAKASFVKARSKVELDPLMAGLRRYVGKTDDRAWCNPTTWLNQERWTDEPPAPIARAGPGPSRRNNPVLDAANALMEKLDAVSPSQTQGNQPYPRLVAFSGSG